MGVRLAQLVTHREGVRPRPGRGREARAELRLGRSADPGDLEAPPDQAAREFEETLLRPAFGRAVGGAGRQRDHHSIRAPLFRAEPALPRDLLGAQRQALGPGGSRVGMIVSLRDSPHEALRESEELLPLQPPPGRSPDGVGEEPQAAVGGPAENARDPRGARHRGGPRRPGEQEGGVRLLVAQPPNDMAKRPPSSAALRRRGEEPIRLVESLEERPHSRMREEQNLPLGTSVPQAQHRRQRHDRIADPVREVDQDAHRINLLHWRRPEAGLAPPRSRPVAGKPGRVRDNAETPAAPGRPCPAR